MEVVMRLLPDGSGRVCIHWLYRHPEGPIETSGAFIQTNAGVRKFLGEKWRMACNPALSNITSPMNGARIVPWVHSDDPRAVTCPRCMATKEYEEAMKVLGETVPVSAEMQSKEYEQAMKTINDKAMKGAVPANT